ncbi:hypothetical protein [Paenibacillus sabinae]|uniref:Uncharacterized protein n=1 Tax=Paenibacillus sabinae T27 TaxID=1268072 RepID=X4ZWQ8_9BACL|nr:hypothetical protein [Paenibacillus sabinae]AHV96144.1 hypothetical protein PSAB_06040 [Paenibacillus sabinae T27]
MEMMLNGIKYKYVSTKAFGHKVMSYVNTGVIGGPDQWTNDTETNLSSPIENIEQFYDICDQLDRVYN